MWLAVCPQTSAETPKVVDSKGFQASSGIVMSTPLQHVPVPSVSHTGACVLNSKSDVHTNGRMVTLTIPETKVTYKANNEAHAEAWKCALDHAIEIAKKYEGIQVDQIDEFSQVLSRGLLSSLEKMHNLRDDRKMMKAEADEREARLNDPQSAQFADALESISGVVTSLKASQHAEKMEQEERSYVKRMVTLLGLPVGVCIGLGVMKYLAASKSASI